MQKMFLHWTPIFASLWIAKYLPFKQTKNIKNEWTVYKSLFGLKGIPHSGIHKDALFCHAYFWTFCHFKVQGHNMCPVNWGCNDKA